MIRVDSLVKSFGPVRAVDGVSFEVRPRELVGFLGPNGAGKTTTLRVLSGFLSPTSGSVSVAGRDLAADGLEARRRVGYLPENNPLYEELEVAEYLEWSAAVRGLSGADAARRVRYAVEACALGEALGKPIGLLSRGFRQRTGLAAAILHDPEVLLLDEPTSGLDPNQAREVRELILGLKQEKAVLFSTHILPEVSAACDRVLILHKGRIAAAGSPRELLGSGGGSRVRAALRAGKTAPAEIESAAGRLPGAGSISVLPRNGEFLLTVEEQDGADLREAVFRLAADKGWALLELGREEASLEAVFRELTAG